MPNTGRPDFIPTHQHSPEDVAGLGVYLFPPTAIVDGVTVDPTRSLAVYAQLTDMVANVTPPSWFPLWEATVTFTGTFSSDTANEGALTIFTVDGVQVAESERAGTSLDVGNEFEIVGSYTALIAGGVESVFRVLWKSSLGGAVATAEGTLRHLEVQLRPYAPVPS